MVSQKYIYPSLFPEEELNENISSERKDIPNDGKQTPMRGHPVFLAQHATGCCCRGCFFKWHHIPAGRALTKEEQEYAVAVLMAWIEKQMNKG